MSSGARVVWLDQVLPMYRKDEWAVEAVIGMVKSTNHRFRVVTIFRKLDRAATAHANSRGKKITQRTLKGLTQPALEASTPVLGHVAD